MSFPTSFYVKVAAASFTVRRPARAPHRGPRRAGSRPSAHHAPSLAQLGAFMEVFMIKTGFYDV
jgi:hypothetical protein